MLDASSATLAEALAALWIESFFLTAMPALPVATATTALRFVIQAVTTRTPPPRLGLPIYQARDLAVYKTAVGFLLVSGQSWLALDLPLRTATGTLAECFWASRPQDQRDFFLLAFLMLSHRCGYYGLHANALSDGQRDYLVIGPSGSGKSTLTVQLLAQGWRCGGDDLLLLHRHKGDGQVYAHALRRDFALAPRTLACVPALVNAQTSAGAVLDKQIVAASLVAPAALQTIFLPTRLLFAEIVDAAASTVSPLPATQAVVALAQQSAGIMTDRAIAPAQVTLLAQLAQSAPSYRLALGRDVFTDPAGVAQRLQDP